MKIGRRRFIGFMAGAAAGSTLGISAGKFFADALKSGDNLIDPPGGPESFVLSVCDLCPAGCGTRARKIGSRVVKLEGNPLHPISGGRLCAKGQAALQWLYHPDRIATPLRRVGPRGSIRSFRRATWNEAMGALAVQLSDLRQRPEGLVLLRRNHPDLGTRLARRFVHAFGSPNDVSVDRADGGSLALFLTQGVRSTPNHDIRQASYVLSLGSELLETPTSPVYASRSWAAFRQNERRRGKLVQVDPRLSATGASADEWIPINSGTHGIFALGVAGVILAESLHDAEFVSEHVAGLESPNGGLRRLLEERFRLNDVAAQTGTSVNVILRTAREFAAGHGVAIGPRKGPTIPGSVFDHLATHVLNALVGNVDQPGGVLMADEPPAAPWPAVAQRRTAPRLDGIRSDSLLDSDPEQLAAALLAGEPYESGAMLIDDADPLFISPTPERFAKAMERVPLVATWTVLPTETALHSDWILPRAHFLERRDLHRGGHGVPFPLLSISAPAVDRPLVDARPMADVVLDLARRTGLESSFPWADSEAIVKREFASLYEAHRGAVMGTDFDEAWIRMVEGAGWWAPGYHSAEEMWNRASEAGGWWDPFYDHGDWKRVLRTESGRLELKPDILEGILRQKEPEPIQSGRLAAVLFEPLAVSGGTGAEIPFLQQILDASLEEKWETWGEIHPDTARELGISDLQHIRVTSGAATVVVRARVTPRVIPGVIAIPVGLGKGDGGRWSDGVGANPLRLIGDRRESITGAPDISVVWVDATPKPAANTGRIS